jgi:Icc-related predicted phosphoesterase
MPKLIIDLLSDTHNQHNKFECSGGDMVIHAGDCTGRGSIGEALNFLDWYAELDYSRIILVPGNHDWCFEGQPGLLQEECKNRGIILLNDSGFILKDMSDPTMNLKIWGSPVQPWFHDWAFNRTRGEDIKRHWDLIPPDTEILITHGPPAGILDEVKGGPHTGCEDLLNKIKELPVKLHVFGHIHEGRGIEMHNDVLHVNASCLNRMYSPAAKKPIRITREIIQDGSVLYIEE